MKKRNSHINLFVRSYLATAIWVEFDSDEEIHCSLSTIRLAFIDCARFIEMVRQHFSVLDATFIINNPGKDIAYLAAFDLYLTRNRHGSGFWDGWEQFGAKLVEISHEMGECQLYAGDDGKAYFM